MFYWLTNELSDASFITVVDAFPESDLTTPTVSIEWDTIEGMPLELGTRELLKERVWNIDIFAVNKSQRDDLTYRIFNQLQYGVPVYDYDEGFPPSVTDQTRLGNLIPVSIDIRNLHSYIEKGVGNNTEMLFYRAVVIFTATFDRRNN